MWIWVAVNAVAEDLATTRRLSICGPRCVQRVLEQYGVREDLAALVKEMQGGVVERLCSMHDIESALSKRGIHSMPLKLGWLGYPNWHNPVILHYSEEHFVVLDETKGGFSKIRDGVQGLPSWEFTPAVMCRQSGVVLLTSETPIRTDEVSELWWPRGAASLCCLLLGSATLFLCRRISVFSTSVFRLRRTSK